MVKEVAQSSELCLKQKPKSPYLGTIIGQFPNSWIFHEFIQFISNPTNCSLNDVSSFNMERVITIKGTIENMSRAEGMISAKLRQSYESDLQAMAVRIIDDEF